MMTISFPILIAHAQIAVSSTFAASVGQSAGSFIAQNPMVMWIALVLGVPLAFWFVDVLIDMLGSFTISEISGAGRRHKQTPAERAIELHREFEKIIKETGVHTDAK